MLLDASALDSVAIIRLQWSCQLCSSATMQVISEDVNRGSLATSRQSSNTWQLWNCLVKKLHQANQLHKSLMVVYNNHLYKNCKCIIHDCSYRLWLHTTCVRMVAGYYATWEQDIPEVWNLKQSGTVSAGIRISVMCCHSLYRLYMFECLILKHCFHMYCIICLNACYPFSFT